MGRRGQTAIGHRGLPMRTRLGGPVTCVPLACISDLRPQVGEPRGWAVQGQAPPPNPGLPHFAAPTHPLRSRRLSGLPWLLAGAPWERLRRRQGAHPAPSTQALEGTLGGAGSGQTGFSWAPQAPSEIPGCHFPAGGAGSQVAPAPQPLGAPPSAECHGLSHRPNSTTGQFSAQPQCPPL